MAEAYPIELRQRVVASCEQGDGSHVSTGKIFSVGEATVDPTGQFNRPDIRSA